MHTLKWIPRAVLTGLASLATVACTTSGAEGPYLDFDLGASIIQDLKPNGNLPAPRPGPGLSLNGGSLKTDTGLRFSVAPGYTLISNSIFDLAGQFETGLIWNGVRGLNNADYVQVPFLAEAVMTFHLGSRLSPYLGIGGGAVYSDLEMDRMGGRGGPGGDSDRVGWYSTAGAVQGMTGLRYSLNEQMQLGLGYKFLASFPDGFDHVQTHSVSVTFVYKF